MEKEAGEVALKRAPTQKKGSETFTARAARRATMVKEIRDWSIMPTLPSGEAAVSVGEKAVLVLKQGRGSP